MSERGSVHDQRRLRLLRDYDFPNSPASNPAQQLVLRFYFPFKHQSQRATRRAVTTMICRLRHLVKIGIVIAPSTQFWADLHNVLGSRMCSLQVEYKAEPEGTISYEKASAAYNRLCAGPHFGWHEHSADQRSAHGLLAKVLASQLLGWGATPLKSTLALSASSCFKLRDLGFHSCPILEPTCCPVGWGGGWTCFHSKGP
jgi:hypothetical protein